MSVILFVVIGVVLARYLVRIKPRRDHIIESCIAVPFGVACSVATRYVGFWPPVIGLAVFGLLYFLGTRKRKPRREKAEPVS